MTTRHIRRTKSGFLVCPSKSSPNRVLTILASGDRNAAAKATSKLIRELRRKMS